MAKNESEGLGFQCLRLGVYMAVYASKPKAAAPRSRLFARLGAEAVGSDAKTSELVWTLVKQC